MPLVGPQGIYCFYSKPLIKQPGRDDRRPAALEIAAGDGTLSRFLADAGAEITPPTTTAGATSASRRRRQAGRREALRAHSPEVVVCSWPPAGNDFEREVFRTPSVQLYVVIGSAHDFATGNREAYEQQTAFEFTDAPALSKLVLPPELDAAVEVFRRIS